MYYLTIGSATHPGCVKTENQDSHNYVIPEDSINKKKGILLTLADGMVGHSGGAVASKIAVEVLKDEYYRNEIRGSTIIKSLEKSFYIAHKEILTTAANNKDLKNMGTTLTAVVIKKNKLYFAHVGDSRGYLLSKKGFQQFTEDHSLPYDLYKLGRIKYEDIENHPDSNVITRALGMNEKLYVDCSVKPIKLKKHNYVLLCCDGLHKDVSNENITEIIYKNNEPQLICDTLVETAMKNGGRDNITVIVGKIEKSKLFF